MIGELIRLRIPPDEARELRTAAKANTRDLQDEIRHRLSLYREGRGNADASRALGDLMAIITSSAERHLQRTGDADRDRASLLGVVKNAMVWVLDNLGADASQDTGEFPISKGISWHMPAAIRSGRPRSRGAADLGVGETAERQALHRIGEALGFPTKAQAELKLKPGRREKEP